MKARSAREMKLLNRYAAVLFVVAAHPTFAKSSPFYHGPRLLVNSPAPGSHYEKHVLLSVSVNVGNGIDAEAIRGNPPGFQVCYTGGASVECQPLVGGSELHTIDVHAPSDGVAEIRAWVQSVEVAKEWTSRVGLGDVVFTWDSARDAVGGLRKRVASATLLASTKQWSSSSTDPENHQAASQAQLYALLNYNLGLALMRADMSAPISRPGDTGQKSSQSTGGTVPATTTTQAYYAGDGEFFNEAAPLAEAAAALGMASALGIEEAVGALEEVLWLSGPQRSPMPLLPCDYNGQIDLGNTGFWKRHRGRSEESVAGSEGESNSSMKIGVTLGAYPSWGHARMVLREILHDSVCVHRDGDGDSTPWTLEQRMICIEQGLFAARSAVTTECGDLSNLGSVVSVLQRMPSDINEHLAVLEDLASEGSSVMECGVRGVTSSWAFLRGLTKSSNSTMEEGLGQSGSCRSDGKDTNASGAFGNSSGMCKKGAAMAVASVAAKRQRKRLIQSDLDDCFSEKFDSMARRHGVEMAYHWGDDLSLNLPQDLHPRNDLRNNEFGGIEADGNLGADNDAVDLIFIDTLHVYGQLKRELAKFAPFARRYLVLHDTTVDGEYGEALRLNIDTASLFQETGIPEIELKMGLWPAVEEFLAEHPSEWALQRRYTNNNGLTVLKRTSL